MGNTTIGLAVVLGPLCLAIVVLIAIELTDRIPFPQAKGSSRTPVTRRGRPEWDEHVDLGPSASTWSDDRAVRPGRLRRIK